MSGHFFGTKAMLAGVIPPLLHRNERRPPSATADMQIHVEGAPELLYPIPVEAPATTRRAVRLVDFLRPDLQKISLPPGVPTLPAFAAAKAAEMEQRDLTEHDGAGVPDLTPL